MAKSDSVLSTRLASTNYFRTTIIPYLTSIFQGTIETCLCGIDGILVYLDNTLVACVLTKNNMTNGFTKFSSVCKIEVFVSTSQNASFTLRLRP